MSNVTCLLCASEVINRFNNLPGYMEGKVFNIFHCPTCDTSFSMPRIDNNNFIYESIYKNGAKDPAYGRYWTYANQVKEEKNPLEYLSKVEDIYFGVVKAIKKYAKKKPTIRVLEVGCGLGYLTYALNKAGINTLGVDISVTAVDYATHNYGNYYKATDIFKYSTERRGYYDIIISTEVIEHLNNIDEFITALYELLSDAGAMIITTPNKTIYKNRSAWFTELPPVHCWWLSEKSFQYIANKHNMRLRFINMRKYYSDSNILHAINLNKIMPGRPTIHEDGKLISVDEPETNAQNGLIRRTWAIYIKNIMGDKLYNKTRRLYYSFNKNYAVFGKRGAVTCVILKK